MWTVNNLFVLWCFFMITYKTAITQDPVAIIPQGRIVGIKVYAEESLSPIEIFFGVPYAVPPVGRHRFAAPERHSGWRRTFFAHRMPPLCPQAGYNGNDNISEDCLFLNIWTTRRADGKSLPVLVIFYSESWLDGGISLPCQRLAAEGVVVVTVSYRLHLLAFFTLKSLAARGNLALLDQYLAILWIRDNIAAFGGDPTSITLAGHSAGADSILYHLASPRAVGLFQRAIVMSPRDPWKIIEEDKYNNATVLETTSREIAQVLGCDSKSDQELLHCMRARPLEDITALYSNASWSKWLQPIPDDFLPDSEQYLPTPLTTALSTKQSMQLDLLLGAVDLESINYNDEIYDELAKQNSAQIHEYATGVVIPKLLQMFSIPRSEALPTLKQAIHWEYWGTMKKQDLELNSLEALENLARMESAAVWGSGNALLAARLARRVSRLYVYRYSQSTKVDLRGHPVNYSGAVHGSDLLALLGDTLMLQVARRPATSDEKQISALFQQYIIQFVKYGSPARDDEWLRYKVGDSQIHDVSYSRNYIEKKRSAGRDISFWLQYLPQLSHVQSTSEHTEQLKSETGESRLRGGVFAMCGVSVVLLALLIVCVFLLRRQQAHRSYTASEMHH